MGLTSLYSRSKKHSSCSFFSHIVTAFLYLSSLTLEETPRCTAAILWLYTGEAAYSELTLISRENECVHTNELNHLIMKHIFS